MSNDKDIKNSPPSGGLLTDLVLRVKLILRLMADPRISPWLKVLPLGSALYFLVPDILPGPIDDVAIVWLGTYLFIEMCPQEIVQEHLEMIQPVVPGTWRETNPDEQNTGPVVDGEIRDK
jgi:hypothetical protein